MRAGFAYPLPCIFIDSNKSFYFISLLFGLQASIFLLYSYYLSVTVLFVYL